MVQSAPEAADDGDRIAQSRAQFVSSLGRRLDALRQALTALERAPRSPAHRDNLRRRVHAMGAAAGVLGFETVFAAFRDAEQVLSSAAAAGIVSPGDLAEVARTFDRVPSLVLGARIPAVAAMERSAFEPSGDGWPLSIVLFGAAPLAESLGGETGTPAIECERTEDPERAEQIVRVLAPDVAVVDTDRKPARELIETLVNDPLLDPVRVIAVGSFDRPEAAAGLVALGVSRVLPKPVSPGTLRRTVVEVSRERGPVGTRNEPIGDVTVDALGDRIITEVQRGLVDAVKPLGRAISVPLGEGTDVMAAVWSALARVRELVTMRSGGAVRFDPNGPEGAVPLAPWTLQDPRRVGGLGRGRADDVSLAGRRAVVADDDPAIAWFVAALLQAEDVEVFEAHDGRAALELVYDKWPDLVISDILMPGLDGFALCREIKRDIALSDVPVVLLSWKEDLLQRVRELGANADGYVQKEATASTVLERVREVLRPRSRVEGRIAQGGEIRGRLDGLTPRLVLEVVCDRRMNARVSVRDAAFLYEIQVRAGRVRDATRTAMDGATERGARVLSALLGVRAGRFVVAEDVSECRGDFDGTLVEVTAEAVARARSLQRVLSGRDALDVARVEIDTALLAPYIEATPLSVRTIVERLEGGASPKAIVDDGVALHLVESVLSDLVMHGGVLCVRDAAGREIAAPALPRLSTPSSTEEIEPPAAPPASSVDATSAARRRASTLPGTPAAHKRPAERSSSAPAPAEAPEPSPAEEAAPAAAPATPAPPSPRPAEPALTQDAGAVEREEKEAAAVSDLERAASLPASGDAPEVPQPGGEPGDEFAGLVGALSGDPSVPPPSTVDIEVRPIEPPRPRQSTNWGNLRRGEELRSGKPSSVGVSPLHRALSPFDPAREGTGPDSARGAADGPSSTPSGSGSPADSFGPDAFDDSAFEDASAVLADALGEGPTLFDEKDAAGEVVRTPPPSHKLTAPPVSADPEPSPFEVALSSISRQMRSVGKESEPSQTASTDAGDSTPESEEEAAWNIAFEGESDPGPAAVAVEPPEPASPGMPTGLKPPRPEPRVIAQPVVSITDDGGVDLGAAIAVHATDDAEATTVNDRITLKPAIPTSPPPDALRSDRPPPADAADAADGAPAQDGDADPITGALTGALESSPAAPDGAGVGSTSGRPVAATPREAASEEPTPLEESMSLEEGRPVRPAAEARAEVESHHDGSEAAESPSPAATGPDPSPPVAPTDRESSDAEAVPLAQLPTEPPKAREREGAPKEKAPREKAPKEKAPKEKAGWRSVVAPFAIVALAFIAAFTLASVLKRLGERVAAPSASGSAAAAPVVPSVAPSAPPATSSASPVVSAESPEVEALAGGGEIAAMTVQEGLDLPSDLQVKQYKNLGLLEVRTAEGLSIYVDDVPVGPGPLRLVPLAAGRHVVRLVQGGKEQEHSVNVQVGRRTLLGPSAAAAP